MATTIHRRRKSIPVSGRARFRQRRRAESGPGRRRDAERQGLFAASGEYWNMGGTGGDQHDFCRAHQCPDCSAGICSGLAPFHSSNSPLPEYASDHCQQLHAGNCAPPHCLFYERDAESG